MSQMCAYMAGTPVTDEIFIMALSGYIPPDGTPCPPGEFVMFDSEQAQQIQQLLTASPVDGSGSSSSPFPSAEDAATAWGIGFVMVVGCYVIARSVGAVVNFINEK